MGKSSVNEWITIRFYLYSLSCVQHGLNDTWLPHVFRNAIFCWRDLVGGGDVGRPPEIVPQVDISTLFSMFHYLTDEKNLATGWLHGRV